MQGRLRGESLSVSVETECAHCSGKMHLEIDHELTYNVKEEGVDPIVFVPDVDLFEVEEPTIVESF